MTEKEDSHSLILCPTKMSIPSQGGLSISWKYLLSRTPFRFFTMDFCNK